VRLSLTRHRRCARRKIPWLDRRTTGRLRSAVESLDPPNAEVELIVVDDRFIAELNREYRGADRPTDVLSFSYPSDTQGPPGVAGAVGEVYVSHETVEGEARTRGVPPEHLFLRVGVHGVLHVIGYDHETPPDAGEMESEEKRLLLAHLTPSEVEELF
jgi:probable rRNA maturation factor